MTLDIDEYKGDLYRTRLLPIALPGIYLALCIVSAFAGEKSASGGNPFFCVSLPFSLPLVAREERSIVVVVAVLASFWWYFVGKVGSLSRQHGISRVGSGLGALLIGFMVVAETSMMGGEFLLIAQEKHFNALDAVIYLLAVSLLCGAVVTVALSVIAAIRLKQS